MMLYLKNIYTGENWIFLQKTLLNKGVKEPS